jgi:hypothetical protein
MQRRSVLVVVGFAVLACGREQSAVLQPQEVSPTAYATQLVLGPPQMRTFGLMLFSSVALQPRLLNARGDTLSGVPRVAFFSRPPGIVTVSENGEVTGVQMGLAWVVGEVSVGASRLRDSVSVLVLCTMELGWDVQPKSATLLVGEVVQPEVTIVTCSGRIREKPVGQGYTWFAADSTVVSIDQATGWITGRAPGTTSVQGIGRPLAASPLITVTVKARP